MHFFFWLIEMANYLLLLLLFEWTVFSIVGNMCSKDLGEHCATGIVFLFCTALLSILMSLLERHYICFTLCGVWDQNALNNFHCHTILFENVSRLLCKSMLPTKFIKMCVKLEHIHLASCGSRKTYYKGKFSFMINIHHEWNLLEIM